MGIFNTIRALSTIVTTHTIKDVFIKAINIGIQETTEVEVANRVKLVNKLCLLIGSLMLIIIPIVLVKVIYSPFILFCFIIEYLINASVILSNYRGKHRTASLTFYFNQCFFVAFFGTLFGGVELQFAIIFLISVIYLIEQDDFLRTVCFAVAVVDLIILQGVYWYEFEPVHLSKEGKFIIQSLVIGGVMVILFFLSIPYKKSNDNIYKLIVSNKNTRRYLAHTVHEVRSPLNAVHLLLNRLERSIGVKGIDIEPIREELRMMKIASTNGVIFAESSLSLAEIEAGASPPNVYKSIKIKALFAEMIDFFSYFSELRNIRFDFFAPTFPSIIVTDEKKLRHILTNLLSNTIKHGAKKSTCTIRLEADHIGKKWTIEICNRTDSDKEIDSEKLFKPFSRALDGTFNAESTGLGLFICKTKVVELGGDISAVKNTKNRTFTITVTFPLSVGDISSLPRVPIIEKEQAYINAMLSAKKILIADDDELSVRALMMDLDSFGAVPIIASDGEMLVKLANEDPPDVILMDLHMPKLNGEAALEKLKSFPNTQNIPIIIISGDAYSNAACNRLISMGADEYISKPINIRKLTNSLIEYAFYRKFPNNPWQ